VTIDEVRALDAWVRSATAAHPGLPDPWRVTMPPHNGGADLIVQVDPVEAGRRGHGPRDDEVCRIPAGTSYQMARQVLDTVLAREASRR
jgi:hypothetical protein